VLERCVATLGATALLYLAAALSGCSKQPFKDELDPNHPLDLAIGQRVQGGNEVTRLAKRALEERAGPNGGIADFERVLTTLGAICERRPATLRCFHRRRSWLEGFGAVDYYELDIRIAERRAGGAQIVVCYGYAAVGSITDPTKAPRYLAPTETYCGPSRSGPQ
jgi:hypothetical protein